MVSEHTDSVDIQCFLQSMIDALVIDAKVINYYAFAGVII